MADDAIRSASSSKPETEAQRTARIRREEAASAVFIRDYLNTYVDQKLHTPAATRTRRRVQEQGAAADEKQRAYVETVQEKRGKRIKTYKRVKHEVVVQELMRELLGSTEPPKRDEEDGDDEEETGVEEEGEEDEGTASTSASASVGAGVSETVNGMDVETSGEPEPGSRQDTMEVDGRRADDEQPGAGSTQSTEQENKVRDVLGGEGGKEEQADVKESSGGGDEQSNSAPVELHSLNSVKEGMGNMSAEHRSELTRDIGPSHISHVPADGESAGGVGVDVEMKGEERRVDIQPDSDRRRAAETSESAMDSSMQVEEKRNDDLEQHSTPQPKPSPAPSPSIKPLKTSTASPSLLPQPLIVASDTDTDSNEATLSSELDVSDVTTSESSDSESSEDEETESSSEDEEEQQPKKRRRSELDKLHEGFAAIVTMEKKKQRRRERERLRAERKADEARVKAERRKARGKRRKERLKAKRAQRAKERAERKGREETEEEKKERVEKRNQRVKAKAEREERRRVRAEERQERKETERKKREEEEEKEEEADGQQREEKAAQKREQKRKAPAVKPAAARKQKAKKKRAVAEDEDDEVEQNEKDEKDNEMVAAADGMVDADGEEGEEYEEEEEEVTSKKRRPASKKQTRRKSKAGHVLATAAGMSTKASKGDAPSSRKLMLAKLLDEADIVDSDEEALNNAATATDKPTLATPAASPAQLPTAAPSADQPITTSGSHSTPFTAQPTPSITHPSFTLASSVTQSVQREKQSENVKVEPISNTLDSTAHNEQSKQPTAAVKKEKAEAETDRRKQIPAKSSSKKDETGKGGKKSTTAIDKDREYKGMSREERRRLEQEKAKAALAPQSSSTETATAPIRTAQQQQRRMSAGHTATPPKREGVQKAGPAQPLQQKRDGRHETREKERPSRLPPTASVPSSSTASTTQPSALQTKNDMHSAAADGETVTGASDVKHEAREEDKVETVKREEKRVKIPKKEESRAKASKPVKPVTAAKSTPSKEKVDGRAKHSTDTQQRTKKETAHKAATKPSSSTGAMDVDDADDLWQSDSEDAAGTSSKRVMNGLSPTHSPPMSPSAVTSIPITASSILTRSPPRSPPLSPSLEPPATILELMKRESPPSTAPPSPVPPAAASASHSHPPSSPAPPTTATVPSPHLPATESSTAAAITPLPQPVPPPVVPPRQAKTMNSSFWTEEELEALRSGVSQFGMDFDAVKKANPLLFKRRTPANLREKMSALMESD